MKAGSFSCNDLSDPCMLIAALCRHAKKHSKSCIGGTTPNEIFRNVADCVRAKVFHEPRSTNLWKWRGRTLCDVGRKATRTRAAGPERETRELHKPASRSPRHICCGGGHPRALNCLDPHLPPSSCRSPGQPPHILLLRSPHLHPHHLSHPRPLTTDRSL